MGEEKKMKTGMKRNLFTVCLALLLVVFVAIMVAKSANSCWFMPTTMGRTANGLVVPIPGHLVCPGK